MRMPRHEWAPTTPEQRRAIAAARRVAARAARIDAELWAAVQAALDVGVSKTHIAREVSRGRATLYRHVPAKKAGDESDDE